jgi:hypothetical protein
LTTSDQTEPSDDDLDERFRLVRQWPEQVSSRAWRKRAAKELSSAEVEYYFPHVLRREELSEAERTSIFNAWQAFYAARDKQQQREAFLKGTNEVADALGGIISFFGVAGLVGWFFVPSVLRDPYFAPWMYFHWAVALVWGISLVIRSPSFIRNWRPQRAGDKIDFARMKQEVVYVNGHYLPGEHVPKTADEIAIDKTIGRGFDVFLVLLVIGGAGSLDDDASRLMPLWLALVLMFLGGVGTFLMVRLRTLAERVQREWDRDKARTAAAINAQAAC